MLFILTFAHFVPLFAQWLRQAGKPFKVTLVAAMCKLLTILIAILKHWQPWNAAPHAKG